MTQQLQPAKAFIWCAEDLLNIVMRNDVTVYANIDDSSIIHPEVKGVMFSLRTVELLDWLGLAERPPCTLSDEHFLHIGHIHRDWTGWAEVNQSYFDHIKTTGKMVEGYLFKDDGEVVFQIFTYPWETTSETASRTGDVINQRKLPPPRLNPTT